MSENIQEQIIAKTEKKPDKILINLKEKVSKRPQRMKLK